MSKKSVAVRIAGHNYKILSEGDGDSLREIARYVDAAMDRVRERTGTVDTLDISVLTCLNLAREILSLRAQSSGALDDGRLRSLIDRVEVALAAPASGASGASDASDATDTSDDASEKRGASSQDRKRARGADAQDDEPARTLDLSSIEARRDRSGRSDAVDSSEDPMPEARVASGGRERAS